MTAPGWTSGACHCRAVWFRARLDDGLASARRCDCSFCRMRGAVAVSAPLDGFQITAGADCLATYRFGTGVAEHHFCRTCGIYTHHRRRSNPNEYGINLACLDGHSPFDLAEVPVMNGRHHPSDGGGGRAGTLIYRPDPR